MRDVWIGHVAYRAGSLWAQANRGWWTDWLYLFVCLLIHYCPFKQLEWPIGWFLASPKAYSHKRHLRFRALCQDLQSTVCQTWTYQNEKEACAASKAKSAKLLNMSRAGPSVAAVPSNVTILHQAWKQKWWTWVRRTRLRKLRIY